MVDVVILGAGAAGLMCAIEAGKRGRSVLVLDHNAEVGEKIRISGGGRCNFTNLNVSAANYFSRNPHFCKSALARFTQRDFISLIEQYDIQYHERDHGQLFCDGSAEEIIQILLAECKKANVEIQTNTHILSLSKPDNNFLVETDRFSVHSASLVVATGGLSIPKLGATNFGMTIADQFDINVVSTKPGLVPLKFDMKEFGLFESLSGITVDAEVVCNDIHFRENILFTHRGLSGPAILQVSSCWNPGDAISINLLPNFDILGLLKAHSSSRKQLATILDRYLPLRFVKLWTDSKGFIKPMNQYSPKELSTIAQDLTNWQLTPIDTEGYAKAEVTVGGVDTDELSSKTMEAKKVPRLYFIGEVVDVTGWLGGYNFQWAWSSGWAAGQVV